MGCESLSKNLQHRTNQNVRIQQNRTIYAATYAMYEEMGNSESAAMIKREVLKTYGIVLLYAADTLIGELRHI